MGSQMIYLGKPMEAEPYYKEALERSRRLKDEPNDVMINMLGSMATLLNEQGKYVEAEKMNREGLELNRRAHGNDHKNTLVSIGNIGTVLKAQGKYAEAEPFMREAVEGRRRVLGGEHPDTMVAISELEILLQAQGKIDEAEPLCREVLEKQLKLFGYESVDTLISVNSLGGLLLAKQQNKEALATLAPGEAAARKTLAGSARLHRFLWNLGNAQCRVGEFAAAEKTLVEAQGIAAKMRGAGHKDTRNCNQALIDLYSSWDLAAPGSGYGDKSKEWKTKLDAAAPPADPIKK
jgi:tetratricopeptide (TPR) repeat protein